MATLFTPLRFAVVLLTVACATAPTLAQQSTRRVVPVKSTTAAAKPPVKRTTPTVSAKSTKPAPVVASAASKAAVAQPATGQPAVQQAQPVEPRPHPTAKATPVRPVAASGDRHKYLNVGVGLATYYGGGLPLGASFEVDVKNNFSVGGSVDYLRYNYSYYSGRYTFIYAGARGSYHLGKALNVQNDKFDPYVGATLGFRHVRYSDSYGHAYSDYSNGYNSGLYLGVHVGARYLFGPKVGGFAEVGYGVSALRLGLAAKF